MSGKWTQGPWLASTLNPVVEEHRITGRVIAKCDAGRGQFKIDGDEAHANARLIAAAPDLYEALKPFAAHLDVYSDELPDRYTVLTESRRDLDGIQPDVRRTITLGDLRRARAALAKARGEA